MPTFIDLFAGAGGFSEGFLQAEYNGNFYDFLLASDINPTCEVTHRLRYNQQLGLPTEFITKDITDPDYIEALIAALNKNKNAKTVDVLVGGPPCQSFSLAGERRKNDKKDDLFSYYINVIAALRPKYFVMENVAGILTKDNGKIKDRILREIRNIVDYDYLRRACEVLFCQQSYLATTETQYCQAKLNIVIEQQNLAQKRRSDYLSLLRKIDGGRYSESERIFLMNAILAEKNNLVSPLLVSFIDRLSDRFIYAFRNNKTIHEDDRNVIRQALNLMKRQQVLNVTSRKVKSCINECHLNRSIYKERFDSITDYLDIGEILNVFFNAIGALRNRVEGHEVKDVLTEIELAITILYEDTMDTVRRIQHFAQSSFAASAIADVTRCLSRVQLYNIDAPILLNAADYGVPQNRLRVVFIGSRNDQEAISKVQATITESEKVCVAEAIGDLGFIGVGEKTTQYDQEFYAHFQKSEFGSIERTIMGQRQPREGEARYSETRTYAEWSRQGRLNPERFPKVKPVYTAANSAEDLKIYPTEIEELGNHETSNHNSSVQERYALIRKHSSYSIAKVKEQKNPLFSETQKRNYTCLVADKPSTTIVTIGDDFAHYKANRSLTVREMARLQSFDDNFVFQGKRTTGGDRRKLETPQYTQVGNAVPPLMAHAIALEILKKIK